MRFSAMAVTLSSQVGEGRSLLPTVAGYTATRRLPFVVATPCLASPIVAIGDYVRRDCQKPSLTSVGIARRSARSRRTGPRDDEEQLTPALFSPPAVGGHLP